MYEITKKVTNSSTNIQHPVKDIDDHILLTDEQQMFRWRSNFSSVLNRYLAENARPYTGHQTRMRTNTRINTDALSIVLIIAAIKSLQSNKAAGIDGIPAEFYNANTNQGACLLQPLIHEAWVNEILPNEWTDGIIVKIPKKGNLRD